MSVTSWLRSRKTRPICRSAYRPRLESLENRTTPSAGMLDPAFGDGGIATIANPQGVLSVGGNSRLTAIQPDGKIIVVGVNGLADPTLPDAHGTEIVVARFEANGAVDTSFGDPETTLGFVAYDFATRLGNDVGHFNVPCYVGLQPDGKIVVFEACWSFTNVPVSFRDGPNGVVFRLNSDGSLDSCFGTNGHTNIPFSGGSITGGGALQGDGKIVVVSADGTVARLTCNGTFDSSFGTNGILSTSLDNLPDPAFVGNCVTIQPDGGILLGGWASTPDPFDNDSYAIVRLTSAGDLDHTFGDLDPLGPDRTGKLTVTPEPSAPYNFGIVDMAVQTDGNIVAVADVGTVTDYPGNPFGDFNVIRLTSAGCRDSTFGDGGLAVVPGGIHSLALAPDGKIVVLGDTVTPVLGTAVWRLDNTGTLDYSFGNSGKALVMSSPLPRPQSMAIQPDGNIVVFGNPEYSAGNSVVQVARLLGGESITVTNDRVLVTATPGNDTIAMSQDGTNLVVTVSFLAQPMYIPLAGITEIRVYGQGGDDQISLSVSGTVGALIDGQGGSDTYTVTFGNLSGPVTVADSWPSGTGTDQLRVNGTPQNDDLAKSAGSIGWKPRDAGGDYQQWVNFAGMDTDTSAADPSQWVYGVTLYADAGDDAVRDPDSGGFRILGGPGNDTIVIRDTVGSGVTADGGDGSDTYIIQAGNLQGPVNIADTGTTGTDSVTVQGTPAADTITQSGNQVVANGATITLAGVDALAIDGGGSTGDTFTVTGTPTVPAMVTGVSDWIVDGTPGNDNIDLTPEGSSGRVRVRVNGADRGSLRPTGRIIVRGFGGNDDIQAAGGIALPLWLFGGEGDDRLKGGGGNNVLVGGAGDDLLVGGNDRDILIGGTGADRVVGNASDDILIAGATAFDNDLNALAAILAEWTSGRSYAVRVANLNGTGTTFANRLNGDIFLRTTALAATTTVFDDNAEDLLTGTSGQDWFFANLTGGGVRDRITDLSAAEFANDLSFIYAP